MEFIFDLPKEFIRKPAKSLKFKRNKSGKLSPIMALPFINSNKKDPAAFAFWYVPRSGGYMGGYTTGSALALLFMQALQQHNIDDDEACLAKIVMAFIHLCAPYVQGASLSPEQQEEYNTIKGQSDGFFHTICNWLYCGLQKEAEQFATLPTAKHLHRANQGIGFDSLSFKQAI